jgi:2-polyprenyl-3-methyl-5-hydroxy-6-metoxy-1,4-benzoquinol methylase
MIVPYAPQQVPSGARRRLLDRAPAQATVLDIGCWSGFNGRYLMRQRCCDVVGVEPDPEMAALASVDYKMVHCMTIEEALETTLRHETFDVILLLDVLEHLLDPNSLLRQLRGHVRETGHVLVSVPNVAHWSVRKMLLTGRWTYGDNGILDRTHLRFFTCATATELLMQSGYRITHRDYSLDRPPLVALPEHHRSILGRWPGLFAAQILFDVQPATATA